MNKKYIFLIILFLLIFLPKPYNGNKIYLNVNDIITPMPGACFDSCAGIGFNNLCFGLIIQHNCQNPIDNINYFGILDSKVMDYLWWFLPTISIKS